MSQVEQLGSALFIVKGHGVGDLVVLVQFWLLGGLYDVGKVGVEGFGHFSVFLQAFVLMAETEKFSGRLVVKVDQP